MNYQRIHDQIIERAKTTKLTGYSERHHIIPRCMGGTDDLENIVNLTAREHFIVHKLLCEIYPDNKKLHDAVWCMIHLVNKHHERGYVVSNREYERLKLIKSKNTSIRLSNVPKTKEHRQNISIAMTGRTVTNETKEKLRQANLGKTYTRTDEYRKKLSEAHKGKTFTEEHKMNLSKSHKGKIPWNKGKKLPSLSNEHKNKISNSLKGRIVSDKTRNKISSIHKGKVTSEETKEKIRQTKLRNRILGKYKK
jgi:hypothetical protein